MPRNIRSITIDDDIWKEVKIQAEKENRAVSNFIETVLMNYLKNQKETPTD